ncbi:hypothetical protein DdX_12282 [Ditylenchus destructor]|uniref:Uncharacterized protein n=1 Tax=Ditylenchus destructor TaxID=166010 RepID=A0AAD4R3U2_9BILA|nr:hypothetical protein DdX_12282 [Ditylenchus destructor]
MDPRSIHNPERNSPRICERITERFWFSFSGFVLDNFQDSSDSIEGSIGRPVIHPRDFHTCGSHTPARDFAQKQCRYGVRRTLLWINPENSLHPGPVAEPLQLSSN